MADKAERAITERQRYWLGHVRAADTSEESTVAYARAQGLKVKDLYQWKTKLIQLKLYRPGGALTSSSFVPVKAKAASKPDIPVSDASAGFASVQSVVPTASNAANGLSPCALVFPSGLRFEFGESVSSDVIRSVIASASEGD